MLKCVTLQAMVLSEIKRLPPNELRETLDFVRFLRLRHSIEPDQAYFWTKKWQLLERATEKDKKRGRVLGDGSMKGLAKALGK